jgi:hypothetical protein
MASTAHLSGNDDGEERYFDGMRGDAEGPEAEAPDARQARAEALAHVRAARAAKARYERLMTQQADASNRNPDSRMQAHSLTNMLAAHDDRIDRTEVSLAATRIVDQARSAFLDNFLENERENAAAKALVSGVASYAPLLALKPSRRDGGSFVSDPRVWSVGAIALVALGETFKDRIKRVFDSNEQANGKLAELTDRVATNERTMEEVRRNVVPATPQDKPA